MDSRAYSTTADVCVFITQAKHKSIDLVFQNNIPASLSDVLYFDIDTKKMSQVLVLPPVMSGHYKNVV